MRIINNILPLVYSKNESQFRHNKIRWRYGVLRRADVYPLSRDCVFLIWKDIGGGWQRFHRRKYRVGDSVADGWDGDGEGSVGGRIQSNVTPYLASTFCFNFTISSSIV